VAIYAGVRHRDAAWKDRTSQIGGPCGTGRGVVFQVAGVYNEFDFSVELFQNGNRLLDHEALQLRVAGFVKPGRTQSVTIPAA